MQYCSLTSGFSNQQYVHYPSWWWVIRIVTCKMMPSKVIHFRISATRLIHFSFTVECWDIGSVYENDTQLWNGIIYFAYEKTHHDRMVFHNNSSAANLVPLFVKRFGFMLIRHRTCFDYCIGNQESVISDCRKKYKSCNLLIYVILMRNGTENVR